MKLAVVQVNIPSNKTSNQQAAFLWSLRLLFTHPSLQALPTMTEFIFDVATVFADVITEEVRNHLIKLDHAKPVDDARCAFVLGSARPSDGWLGLLKSPPNPTASQPSTPQPLPQNPIPGQNQNQQAYQISQFNSPSPLQRTLSQQQLQQQQQQQQHLQQSAQTRMYPQHSAHLQHKTAMPPFPRMNQAMGQSQQTQFQQMQHLQQMQQMQGLAQQRMGSPVAGQRQSVSQSPTPAQHSNQSASSAVKPGIPQQNKPEVRPVAFPLRWWEILPEPPPPLQKPKNLNNEEEEIDPSMRNATALSLSLFGARKV